MSSPSSDKKDSFKQYERILNTIMKSPPVKRKKNIIINNTIKNDDNNKILEEGIIEEDDPAKTIIDTGDIDFSPSSELCSHPKVTKDGPSIFCAVCGVELYEEVSHEQECRFFSQDSGGKNNNDMSRCQYYKPVEKGIENELLKLGFPPEICFLANQLFIMVTNNDIKKSELRKGIMLATVYQAYLMKGLPKTPDDLKDKFFGLTDRFMGQGFKFYNLRCPRTHFEYEKTTAKHYIPKIMERFNAKEEHITKAIELFEKVKNCPELNRTNPQSVSKAIVFYYLRRKGCNVSLNSYEKIVELSSSSIYRLSSEISRVLGTTHSVDLG